MFVPAVFDLNVGARLLHKFETRLIGLNVKTTFFALRAQHRDSSKYRAWCSRLISGARKWFETLELTITLHPYVTAEEEALSGFDVGARAATFPPGCATRCSRWPWRIFPPVGRRPRLNRSVLPSGPRTRASMARGSCCAWTTPRRVSWTSSPSTSTDPPPPSSADSSPRRGLRPFRRAGTWPRQSGRRGGHASTGTNRHGGDLRPSSRR
jgi:hypothetical protein